MELQLLPPWLSSVFQVLIDSGRARGFFHAYLFSGPKGVGQIPLMRQMAQWLLCDEKQGDEAERSEKPGGAVGGTCGLCLGCRALSTHPDLTWIQVKPGEQIRIETIRTLMDDIVLKPHCASRRVIVIDAMEAMNLYAANAFLKLLEEPPNHVHFLIATYDKTALLPTLLSRCQQFELPLPTQAESLPVISDYLSQHTLDADEKKMSDTLFYACFQRPYWLYEHTPKEWQLRHEMLSAWLKQKETHQDTLFECVTLWLSIPKQLVLLYLQSFLQDAIKCAHGLGVDFYDHPDLAPLIAGLAEQHSPELLLHFYQRTEVLHAWVQKKFNLNWQAYFFQFLVDWNQAVQRE
jgi:DNA polymerase III subunit delta'